MTRRARLAKLEAQARAEAGAAVGTYRADCERGEWVGLQTGARLSMTPLELEHLRGEAEGRAVLFLGAGGYRKMLGGIDAEDL